MIRETIRREVHNPHARSGGSTALICRRVSPLTAAAPRDRLDPRVGIVSVVTTGVQQQLVTFVNVNIVSCEFHLTPTNYRRRTWGLSAAGRRAS